MVLAGLPEPQVDIPIRDADGNIRFRIDLGYEEVKLAIEYDGRWHDAEDQREHDESRRTELSTTEGWTFVVVRAEELYEQPEQLLERLRVGAAGTGHPGPSRAERRLAPPLPARLGCADPIICARRRACSDLLVDLGTGSAYLQ